MSASAGDATTAFTPRAFTFLRGIAKNNRKEWFEAHRADFEREIKRPLACLVEEVDVHLATIAPEIVGSPKKSVFRIHRDVRFSNDKSPYKTHAACWFFHRDAGRGVGTEAAHGGAGFYFHLEPGGSLCGGGIWMPPRSAVHKIRQALTDDLDGFEAIVTGRTFRRHFGALDTDGMLTRLPRGFAADHPAAAWLRYQSYTASTALSPEEITSAALPKTLATHFKAMTPFVRWLNGALGLSLATRR
jgi:uncharacterized protein (TIGR02453 family)